MWSRRLNYPVNRELREVAHLVLRCNFRQLLSQGKCSREEVRRTGTDSDIINSVTDALKINEARARSTARLSDARSTRRGTGLCTSRSTSTLEILSGDRINRLLSQILTGHCASLWTTIRCVGSTCRASKGAGSSTRSCTPACTTTMGCRHSSSGNSRRRSRSTTLRCAGGITRRPSTSALVSTSG